MDKVKKQRIRELEREYLKLSRKEAWLIRKQQNYLIDTSQERKKINEIMKIIEDELIELKKNLISYPVEIKILNTNTATIAIHEVNLIDFKFDILPMPKGRGFLDTNDTCLLK